MISYIVLGAKVACHFTGMSEVVSGEARPQMVFDLKLQPAMEPVHVMRTRDVLRGVKLHAEPFIRFVIVRTTVVHHHGEVRQNNLQVQHTRGSV